MNDEQIESLVKAVLDDDKEQGLPIVIRLIGGVARDLNRIAASLEKIERHAGEIARRT